MRAAVCYEFGSPLEVEDVFLSSPGLGEVEVEIKACAICHSDIAYMDGGWGGVLPVILGHEASGIVTRCGVGVNNVRVGDKVLVTLLRSCGGCEACVSGRGYICDGTHSLDSCGLRNGRGDNLVRGLKTAAFAESVVVHHSQVICFAGLDFAVASLLSCGVLTGFGAVANVACPRPGESAVVIGVGGVGLNSVQALRLSGCYPIVAIDLSVGKLEAARDFGATHVIDAGGGGVAEALLDLTGGRGVDFVFVAAGGSSALQSGFPLLAKGGSLVIVGMTRNGDTSVLDSTTIANSNQRILGSKMGSSRLQSDIPRLLSLYHAGQLKLDELVSGRFALSDINVAIGEVKADKALRHVIEF